jgi:hypothetical protein
MVNADAYSDVVCTSLSFRSRIWNTLGILNDIHSLLLIKNVSIHAIITLSYIIKHFKDKSYLRLCCYFYLFDMSIPLSM